MLETFRESTYINKFLVVTLLSLLLFGRLVVTGITRDIRSVSSLGSDGDWDESEFLKSETNNG